MISIIKNISTYALCFVLTALGYSMLVSVSSMMDPYLPLLIAPLGLVVVPVCSTGLYLFLIQKQSGSHAPKEKPHRDQPSGILLLKKILIFATCAAIALIMALNLGDLLYAVVPHGHDGLVVVLTLVAGLGIMPIVIFVIFTLLRKLFL